jgi:hypothetical protein
MSTEVGDVCGVLAFVYGGLEMEKSATVALRRGPGGKLKLGVGFVLINVRTGGRFDKELLAANEPAVGNTSGVGKLFCCSLSMTLFSASDGEDWEIELGSSFFLTMMDANGSERSSSCRVTELF